MTLRELKEKPFIKTRQVEKGLQLLEDCIQSPLYFEEPLGLAITGITGAGKSTLMKHFKKDYPENENNEGRTVPILYTQVPAKATIVGVQTAMLKALGDPHPEVGTQNKQGIRLIHLIKECNVRQVALDEFQHLIEKRTTDVIGDVADWLKVLMISTNLPIVLIGQPSGLILFEEEPQIGDRITLHHEMSYASIQGKENIKEYRKILKSFEFRLELPVGSLQEPEVRTKIFVATQGSMRRLNKLISYVNMKREQSTELTMDEQLAQAFDTVLKITEEVPENPFRITIARIKQWPMLGWMKS